MATKSYANGQFNDLFICVYAQSDEDWEARSAVQFLAKVLQPRVITKHIKSGPAMTLQERDGMSGYVMLVAELENLRGTPAPVII